MATFTVPVAKDESTFMADLVLLDGSYRIGPKGAEHNVLGYREALAELRAMPTPYWRRPSSTSGMAGIVKGVRWITVTV